MHAGNQHSPEHLLDEIERRDQEIARLKARLRSRPDGPTEDRALAEDLTAREAEVLERIAQGLSTQEIADDLYLGVNSIKTHTQSLFRKLGVTSRTQAALWAVRHDGRSAGQDDDQGAAASRRPAPRSAAAD